MLVGNVEVFTKERLVGWLADDTDPVSPLICVVDIDGSRHSFMADIEREDLATVFEVSKRSRSRQHLQHGFDINLGEFLSPGDNKVTLTVDGYANTLNIPSMVFSIRLEELSFPLVFLKDTEAFSFKSDFRSKVAEALEISSFLGSERLQKALTETKMVFLLFTNRSGSNLITDMLAQMGVGGGATNEPLLVETILSETSKSGIGSLDHYLAEVIFTWRRNGYCFLKLSWDSFSFLLSEGVIRPELLRKSAVVTTFRRDKILQAISYWKILNTGRSFVRGSTPVGEEDSRLVRTVAAGNQTEVLREIAKLVYYMHLSDHRVRYLAAVLCIQALELTFEDIVADLLGTYEKLRRFLEGEFGVELSRTAYNPSLQRQSTDFDSTLKNDFVRAMRHG